ncbi:MAG: glycosyltransferase [Aestuariivirga sp.]|uniref:glycosyltransferase family 2 protein n=1 Tax=Aestuariivirga sp. TaxID=2650926 RepID=UPI0025C0D321|nr:glycosyltransferase [Aestuariivirga sp.]MCA3562118.1 glycosyltransferase [Aestuariivirga sp.]
MTRVTICIPVRNGDNYLEQALASIAMQTCPADRVLVSDNASTDRTADILEAWKQRLPLEVIRQPALVSMVENFNGLLDRVEDPFYMVLSHDDYLNAPDAISSARAVLEANSDVSAVYCDLAYVGEKRRRLATRRFHRTGRFDADEAGRQSIFKTRNMFGIPLLVRRSALGPHRYDPAFRYGPDLDLSWRISRLQPAWHIPRALIANRYHAGNSTWGWLGGAADEYLRLASKHGMRISPVLRAQIRLRCWSVGQQRRLFGAYERLVSRLG